MAGKLVTIATFDQAGQAHVAKNALETAGIKVALADESLVSMDWLLSNAVGGIKVQVLDEDAERAVAVLEDVLGSEPTDEAAMAAEAEAAEREEMDEESESGERPAAPPAAPQPEATAADDGAPDRPSERDEYTRRLFLAALFGLVVPLLWFYAVYLFLNAVFGQGSLSPRRRSQLVFGGVLLVCGFVTSLLFIRYYGDPFP